LKVAHVRIERFKRIRKVEIPIRNDLTKDIADQFLILGDNGTGKTTVLQAVGLCLSMASRRIRRLDEFDWLGWLPGRYGMWGSPEIELEVHFADREIEATREAARRWFELRRPSEEFREPSASRVVRLRLRGSEYSTEGDPNELYQFRGRSYAAGILKLDPTARDLFDDLPGIFWFDQFRNLATPPEDSVEDESQGEGDEARTGRTSYKVGVARLREHLNRWQLAKLLNGARPGAQHDFLLELENLFKKVFPGRSFAMPEPMYRGGTPTPSDYYFILSDGHRTYDIEEMSAGEQSVFPMLYEFVRQQIRNSIVLIDEVDLNLHPPLAQALLQALPAMGPNCQFLLTTHSQAISSVMSAAQIYRLEGGKLCL
jgi:predicted ATPase